MQYVHHLEDVASAVVCTDVTDDAGLAHLQQQLRMLETALAEELSPAHAKLATLAHQQIADLRGAAGSPAENMAIVADAIATLQRHAQPPHEISLASLPATLRTALEDELPAPSEASAPAAESFADPGLVADFVTEALEHLETADAQLLALETRPTDNDSVGSLFRAFHTIKGVAGCLGLTTINRLAHEAENILDKARNQELAIAGPVLEALFGSSDLLKRLIGCVASGASDAPLQAATQAQIERLVRVAQAPHEATLVASEPVASPEATSSASKTQTPETLKVDRVRLDRLVDMIGELVIAESMVQQELTRSTKAIASGSRSLSQLNKITRNLQELSLALRMVPVRSTFQKMARVVRDLSKKLQKPIDLHLSGEDTELDKTVVDQIGDPLMHMVRNAVDHGIERTSAERVAAGKPANGQVHLRAFHQGGNIYIEIEDDGKGLNRERILAKARERGLISEDAALSDKEVAELIFAPGFSTAEAVTDVSGRGVGMDVVRRNVEALRGAVEIRSKAGQGTCLSMRLPLTLAIIDGMVVRIDQERYIVPTLSIVELLCPRADAICTVQERNEYFTLRERQLPLVRVSQLLQQRTTKNAASQGIIVVVEDAGHMAGLLVDEVLGQQQVVIKSLGHSLEGQPGVSGGAVMPDGRVGLILDIHGLLGLAQSDQA